VTFLVRAATDADLVAVGELHHRSRLSAYADLIPRDELTARPASALVAWWTERWRYEQDTHRMTVATSGHDIVGFSYAGATLAPDTAELCAIHVDPTLQGRGLGTRLMDAALAWFAADAHWQRAELWVLSANVSARRFYERLGWATDGGHREGPIGAAVAPQVRYSIGLARPADGRARLGEGA